MKVSIELGPGKPVLLTVVSKKAIELINRAMISVNYSVTIKLIHIFKHLRIL